MNKRLFAIAALCIGLIGGFFLANRLGVVQGQGQRQAGSGFAAVPGKGGQDVFGPYDPVPNWRKPLDSTMPQYRGWTYSQATDVYAEANRVIVAQKGLLPVLPQFGRGGRGTTWLPEIAPGLKFPIGGGVPLRETASATPSCGDVPRPQPNPNCAPVDATDGRPGVDWKWEQVMVEFDANGNPNAAANAVWAQYDKLWGRPHDVEISPYDPQKRIFIVDADNHFVAIMSNDAKQRLMTLGTPGVRGNDDTHFARPTFLAFMDANTWYLADGYDNTRVIKYDMAGKKLLQWGERGTTPNEQRPGYWNNVHGIAVNAQTRRVYVNDRANGRVQVFDENGKFLDSWKYQTQPNAPSNIHAIYMGNDGKLWAADQTTHKMLGYDANGNFIYSWGTFGTCEGCLWGVHGFMADAAGNLWTSSVRDGRAQKFTPRQGANPEFLIAKPWGPR
jgi:DNA-binding beta-propeller fold protein YncE